MSLAVILGLSDGVAVALVVGLTTLAATLAPVLLAVLMSRANLRAKERDWDRQDIVASRAAAAAASAAATQAALVAGQQMQTAKLQAVEEQNRVIHALVNSAYTASLAAQLVALEGQLALSRELAALLGTEHREGDTRIEDITQKVDLLRRLIADRLHQQYLAEEQVAEERARLREAPPRRRATDPPAAAD